MYFCNTANTNALLSSNSGSTNKEKERKKNYLMVQKSHRKQVLNVGAHKVLRVSEMMLCLVVSVGMEARLWVTKVSDHGERQW